MYRLATKHSEKPICRNFRVWNSVIKWVEAQMAQCQRFRGCKHTV